MGAMPEDQNVSIARLIPKIALQMLFFAALLFVPAGTLRWWQGWVYIALSLGAGAAGTVWLGKTNPDLLRERLKPMVQKDQPKADKRATLIFLFLSILWLVFIPFDVFHLHLLPPPPPWLRWTGLALWAVSMWLIYLTFRENSFAAPVVKHQEDRQQTVITTGPYAVVRHPLYSAVLIYAIGIALWLGSIAAVPLVALPLIGLVLRIRVEESYLAHHLPGYEAYLRERAWRIVPYVW
jgi:protein-S-isoprenylcysteine O-methyltransferase Ste14